MVCRTDVVNYRTKKQSFFECGNKPHSLINGVETEGNI
jgi:hypothetical protein